VTSRRAVKFVYHLNRAGSVGFVPSPDVIGMSPIGGGRPASYGTTAPGRNVGRTLFPDVDLGRQKVGLFGKVTTLDAVLSDGDRIEIYRPLTVDPKTVKQKTKPGKSDSGDAE
jgi:hypothetical protein